MGRGIHTGGEVHTGRGYIQGGRGMFTFLESSNEPGFDSTAQNKFAVGLGALFARILSAWGKDENIFCCRKTRWRALIQWCRSIWKWFSSRRTRQKSVGKMCHKFQSLCDKNLTVVCIFSRLPQRSLLQRKPNHWLLLMRRRLQFLTTYHWSSQMGKSSSGYSLRDMHTLPV